MADAMADEGGAGGRARRQATVVGRGGAKAKSALAELAELRKTGKKRADAFEVAEEDAVYDMVDDAEYAALVQRRRAEGGGFVVGDERGDAMGYADIGEEVDWGAAEGGDDDAGAGAGAKGKAAAAGGKRKAAAEPAPAPGAKARMARMFQSAAVKRPPAKAAKVDDGATEALLDDILGNLGAGEPAAAAGGGAAPPPAAAGAVLPRARLPPAPAPRLAPRPAPAPAPRAAPAPAPRAAPAPAPRRAPPAALHRLAASAVAAAPPPPKPEPADEAMPDADADFGGGDDGGHYDDDAPAAEEPAAEAPAAAPPAAARAAVAAVASAAVRAEMAAAGTPGRAAGGPPSALEAPAPASPDTPGAAAPAPGWQALVGGGAAAEATGADGGGDGAAAAAPAEWVDDGSLPLEADGETLPMFLVDAHEEAGAPGVVHLFGKVPSRAGAGAGGGQAYASCCAVVRGLQRAVLFVPRDGQGTDSPELAAVAADLAAAGGDDALRRERARAAAPALHAAFAAVKAEVRALLAAHGVSQMTMKPVLRSYAFDNAAVKRARQWVLKVKYAAAAAPLPLGLSGDTFVAAFGANQSPLEALVLKRRLMGPGWVALRRPRRVAEGAQVSWCRLEVELDSAKAVGPHPQGGTRDAPPLTVASVHLQTVVNPATAANEVAAASVVYLSNVTTERPMALGEWNTPRALRHFSAVRKLDGVGFPPGFDAEVARANGSEAGRRNGGAVLCAQPSERALLTMLLARLRGLDADVLVGHNFAAFHLDVLLHRAQALRVPHWSSLGRLRRSRFPALGGGGHAFGGGASPGALACVAGRLVCDTYLAAREAVREVDYTLGTLARTLLGQARAELPPAEVRRRFDSAAGLAGLVQHCESDAWLALGLAFYLSVLPLSRQLAALSGSLWGKALLGQRAQRIEMLLAHEFHARKFMLPDRLTARERERLAKAAAAEGGGGGDDDGAPAAAAKAKGPQYAGGLVLEPKKGLYERYVLLLDFNSLYPSIIQEYNICFTTVARPEGDGVPPLPDAATRGPGGDDLAPLPRVVRALVERRRAVKAMMRGERDATRRAQLELRQQALKLTANSMYGCLGFGASRFYAKPLAQLVTAQGREILQSTVDLVRGSFAGADVIYGDTDSVMVATGSLDLPEVLRLGAAIKKEVNKRYRLLEIEVDGVYRRMLLLKKKKYAAVKVEPGGAAPGAQASEALESKGLDIVRRDWAPLAKDAGNAALAAILGGAPREEAVAAIHDHLAEVAEKVRAGAVPLNKFVVTKQLTKRPEDYPDARNQPHVQVALRRRAAGRRDGVLPGETVPYVICVKSGDGAAADGADGEQQKKKAPAAGSSASLAERAYHPDEVAAPGSGLSPDAEYYLAHQVHPVVARLCAVVEGTDAARLAEALGLDGGKYRAAAAAAERAALGGGAPSGGAGPALDADDRFAGCDPLLLAAPGGARAPWAGVRAALEEARAAAAAAAAGAPAGAPPPPPRVELPVALTPAQAANQVTLAARAAVAAYYEGRASSDDEALPCATRDVCLRPPPEGGRRGSAPPDARCAGVMRPAVTEAALYTTLCHLHRLFDAAGAVEAAAAGRGGAAAGDEAAAALAPLRGTLDAAAAAAAALRDASAFRWVDMAAVFGGLAAAS